MRNLGLRALTQLISLFKALWISASEVIQRISLVSTAADAIALLPLDNLDLERAQSAFNVRVCGILKVVKHSKSLFNKGGSLSLTIGTVAAKPRPGWSVAAAVNGSVESLVCGVAVDLSPLRVNAVASGVVATGLWDAAFEHDDAAKQAFFDSTTQRLLTKVIGEPEDIPQSATPFSGRKAS